MRYGLFYSIYKILYPTVKYDSKPSNVDLRGANGKAMFALNIFLVRAKALSDRDIIVLNT